MLDAQTLCMGMDVLPDFLEIPARITTLHTANFHLTQFDSELDSVNGIHRALLNLKIS